MKNHEDSSPKNLTVLPKIKKEAKEDIAYVELNGERFEYESLIIAGELTNGKRGIYTFNCTTDELAGHLKALEINIDKTIEETMW